jgi:hypothetical protein
MKKHFQRIKIAGIALVIMAALSAQGPPSPPVNPDEGGGPVGGAAPLGPATSLMLALGLGYGAGKTCRAFGRGISESES